jgi:hypothetical protein
MEFLQRSHVAPPSSSSRMLSASYFQTFYNPSCSSEDSSSVSIKNQLILCTGGNGGIGYETVKELVFRGAHVIIAARNQQRNEECVTRIKNTLPSDCPGDVSTVRLDLSDLPSIIHTVSELKLRYPERTFDQLICKMILLTSC